MGQPTQIERNGVITYLSYTPQGRVAQMLVGDRDYRYTYDEAGRLVSTQQPNGQTKHYLYDEAGRRTGIRDSLGNVYQLQFNEANQVTQKHFQSSDHQGAAP